MKHVTQIGKKTSLTLKKKIKKINGSKLLISTQLFPPKWAITAVLMAAGESATGPSA